jgi:hypothetical protein
LGKGGTVSCRNTGKTVVAGRLAALWGSAVVGLVLGACGGGKTAAPPTGPLVVPPIQAVDRSLPASAFGRNVAFIRSGCLEVPLGPGVGPPRTCEPGRDALAGRPQRPETIVHLRARLPLRRPALLAKEVFFAVYASRGSGTCFSIVYAVATSPLRCDGKRDCADICLRSFPDGREASLGVPGTGIYMLVAGTVPASAKALRLHFPGGRAVTYALRGPLARDFPGRRIFMADVGRRPKPVRAELL